MAKNDAAGMAFTIRSWTRRCAPTASTKYSVSIAVVRRASPGILPAESRPTTEAALDAGRSHRMFCGTPKVSRALWIGGTGIAHPTASTAWNAASAAYVLGDVRPPTSLPQLVLRRQGGVRRQTRVRLCLGYRLDDGRVGLGGEPAVHVLVVVLRRRGVVDRRWLEPEHPVLTRSAQLLGETLQRRVEVAGHPPHLVGIAARHLRQGLQILVGQHLRGGPAGLDRGERLLDCLGLPLRPHVGRGALTLRPQHPGLPVGLGGQDRGLLGAFSRQNLGLLGTLGLRDRG